MYKIHSYLRNCAFTKKFLLESFIVQYSLMLIVGEINVLL